MPTIRGTLDEPLAEAMLSIRRQLATRAWLLAEGQSGPQKLVFMKGVTLWGWGSRLDVWFEVVSPSRTGVTITSSTTLGNDWGRGRRTAAWLLASLGADAVDPA